MSMCWCLSHPFPGTSSLFRPSGGMQEVGQLVPCMRLLLCPPPQPSALPITVIVLNHTTEHVTLLALHRGWLPFASGIKSKLFSVAQETPKDLATPNLLPLFSPLSGPLHVLFPLLGIPIPELCMVRSPEVLGFGLDDSHSTKIRPTHPLPSHTLSFFVPCNCYL